MELALVLVFLVYVVINTVLRVKLVKSISCITKNLVE